MADRYGEGHYSTRASHEQRWQIFAQYMKQAGIKDARQINQEMIRNYATFLKAQVKNEEMKVAYAQNLLSTVDVVLQTMRKDSVLKIGPAASVGNRSNVRTTVPKTLRPFRTDRPLFRTDEPLFNLRENGEERTALVVQLCRMFGLRFKEASLLNANLALKEAQRINRINITEGTKGGRGKGADRWVPVNNEQLTLLSQAAELQRVHYTQNLIPSTSSYKEWRYHAYYAWREAAKDSRINGFHDLRAAYACERYQQITGCPAPVVTGQRQASKELDRQARTILAGELGHGRTDVVAAYIGSSK